MEYLELDNASTISDVREAYDRLVKIHGINTLKDYDELNTAIVNWWDERVVKAHLFDDLAGYRPPESQAMTYTTLGGTDLSLSRITPMAEWILQRYKALDKTLYPLHAVPESGIRTLSQWAAFIDYLEYNFGESKTALERLTDKSIVLYIGLALVRDADLYVNRL